MANDKLAAKDLQNKPLSARQPSKKKTVISVKEIKINASSDDQSKANNNKLNTNNVALKITFQLKYRTQYGQNLYITGNHPLLGNGDTNKALPLRYLNEELWSISIEIDKTVNYAINYNYILQNADGTFSYDWGSDKTFNPSTTCADEILMLDSWNYAGYYENAFYSEAFKNVLLKSGYTKAKIAEPETFTHIFKI